MNQDQAETVALRALAWLAGNEALLPIFLGATGTALTDLRDRAAEPEFLVSVVDFLLMDDAWVIGCSDALGLRYETLAQARAALPGGAQVHWT
ncbi:DUF3572 domain-containing protein [Plastorhodobacter daqingensis]|uniref:DUF3572 domain-containing protein n=1 Tax=Plastorhodobacter daqingensis TaxID=1387281 RepID=A0ABW2UID7_9RHOB